MNDELGRQLIADFAKQHYEEITALIDCELEKQEVHLHDLCYRQKSKVTKKGIDNNSSRYEAAWEMVENASQWRMSDSANEPYLFFSANTGEEYQVYLKIMHGRADCGCYDAKFRDSFCKHQVAALVIHFACYLLAGGVQKVA